MVLIQLKLFGVGDINGKINNIKAVDKSNLFENYFSIFVMHLFFFTLFLPYLQRLKELMLTM